MKIQIFHGVLNRMLQMTLDVQYLTLDENLEWQQEKNKNKISELHLTYFLFVLFRVNCLVSHIYKRNLR